MRILVVSDTHKKHENLKRVLERVSPVDLLIHLGDSEGCEDIIGRMAGCPVEIVAGNNDFFSDIPKEKELQIGNYRALITHGHLYSVGYGTAEIRKEAEERGMDLVMFGHTHIPLIEYGGNVIALNPGSISYPRQQGQRPSYLFMETDKKGKAFFDIEYL